MQVDAAAETVDAAGARRRVDVQTACEVRVVIQEVRKGRLQLIDGNCVTRRLLIRVVHEDNGDGDDGENLLVQCSEIHGRWNLG